MRIRLALGLTVLAACHPASKQPAGEPDGGGQPADASIDTSDPDAEIDAPPDAGPDVTAPSVVDISPATGSNAWLHAPIRLTFDEDLATDSLATVTATIDGTAVDASVVLENARTLAITIAPSARGLGALSLHVQPSVTDLAGNACVTPVDIALQLPAWSGAPIDRGVASGAPSYVVDARGTVTAAWLVGPVGLRRAVIAELVGSAWRDLGGDLGISDATSVSLALDEAGTPLVAVADDGVAHVARWNGASWTELPSPGTGSHVAIATPAGGHPIVAVFGSTIAVRELVNNTWQPLGSDITPPAVVLGEPALATPAAGKAVVGWIDATAQVRVYRLDTNWTPFATLVAGSGSRMSLAARGSSVAVAYDKWGGSFAVIAALAANGATTFTQLGKPLDVDIAGDARNPAIALDASGAPIVAWTELIEAVQRGVVARWSGSAWTIVGGLSFLASTAAIPGGTRIVLDGGDAPVVAAIAGGTLGLARFNGPRTASLGLSARASLAGCSFDPAAPPALLSQTGCFDLSTAKWPVAHAGLVPYDVVAELWTDGAKKRRWIALPAGASMTLGSNGAWAAPVGTFMVKEFALETTPGNPATRRPVETRFLFNDATNGWVGFSYRWNTGGTDASLLADAQYNIDWQMDDGSLHTHVYPSRQHCRSCHYYANGPLLGLRPEQLARWYDYNGVIADQLATLAALGVGPATTPPAFTAPHDPTASWETRTRGYMAANCSHCHNPNYISIKDLRFATPLSQTRLCEVITPGSPTDSIVYQKVTSRPGMPPLGTAATDPLIAELLGNWITGMTSCP